MVNVFCGTLGLIINVSAAVRIQVAIVALVLVVNSPVFAQDNPTFEVASIRLNKGGDREGVRILPGGRIEIINLPLRGIVRLAYTIPEIQRNDQITGGPDWVNSERYDIVAKADGDPGFDPETGQPVRLIAMLRSLLEERFHLHVRRETRDVPIYALRLSGSEPKFGTLFKPTTANCYTRESPRPTNAAPDPARMCGTRGGNGNVTYVSVSMDQIAASLANYPVVGRPVLDRTGLQGKYDLHLEFIPAFVDSQNRDGSVVANPNADSGPNLFTALAEQAGLRLQTDRGPLLFIVIDRAEKPTED